MSMNDRTLLAAFLAGNITEAHKAAPPANISRSPKAGQDWHDAASEDERTRSRWATTVIAAADTRNRQRAVAGSSNPGSADYAEQLRTQADNLDAMAAKQLSNAVVAGAFDAWPMPATM